MNLRHYLNVIRRNIWVIAVVVLLAIAVGLLQASRQPDVYEARARILLLPENLPVDPTFAGSQNRFDPFRYGNVQLAVIFSQPVVVAAAAELPDTDAAELYENVAISIDELGSVLRIVATAPDPDQAALRANAVVEAYVEQRTTEERTRIERGITELEGSQAALQERLDDLGATGDPNFPSADLTATQNQFSTVFSQLQGLRLLLTLQRDIAQVLQVADAPEAPVGLGLPSTIVLAALLGGVIGLGVAFAREELDDRVRSRQEVQELVSVPVLAELPVDRGSARSTTHLATVDDPLGGFAEAMRSLRTSIGFLSVDRPGGIGALLVTSTSPGDGKSLVAANLAIAYALAGHRTVVVSADLRRPRVEELFDTAPGGVGLTDAFTSDRPRRGGAGESVATVLSRATVSTRVEGLWLLPAGSPVPNPAELLSSSRMDEVLAGLSEAFDMVIVDTTPLLAVADAATLAPKVGEVLLVASMQDTGRRSLLRSAEILHATRARILGVVLNRVSGSVATYGGGYAPRPANRPEPATDVPALR